MGRYVLGVDLGGTNIRVVLLNEAGRVCSYLSEPTKAEAGPPAVISQIADLAITIAQQEGIAIKDILGLGIGLPGVIDNIKGIAITLPNLKGWRDIPVAEMLSGLLGLPVYCENDARMAAWGEKLLGAGQNHSDIICVTIGTGVGSGIFLGGRLWRGHLGSAGEIGHLTIHKDGLMCSCGNRGCLELYASGGGIARRAKLSISSSTSSLILQYAGGNIEQVSSFNVLEAARAGDQTALRLIIETAEILGLGLANVANILNPQLIILGGGVSEGWGDLLLEPLREEVKRRAMSLNKQVVIQQAQLGEQAGVIGAATLASLLYLKEQKLHGIYC